jgi:hypothetical protein
MARKPLMIKVVQIETAELGLKTMDSYTAERRLPIGPLISVAEAKRRAVLRKSAGPITTGGGGDHVRQTAKRMGSD